MRVLAPIPESAAVRQVVDGYQLCARCGGPLVAGESAVVVSRLPSGLIYAHKIGSNCPSKAVRGWKAARSAESIRKQQNKADARKAAPLYIAGSLHTCMSLLDDQHISAELALVEYWPSDEAVANSVDVSVLLSRFQFRAAGCGKHTTVPHNQETGVDRGGGRQFFIRNSVEDGLVTAIDENALDSSLQLFIECLWSCRRKTYAMVVQAPSLELAPLGPVSRVAEVKISPAAHKTRLSKADTVLSRDVSGKPVEFPLYSKRPVLRNKRKWISEFECWAPKPNPVELRYNSITDPKLFLWAARSLRQLGSVDSSNPYGPVAMLMRESIEKLNTQRNVTSRGENIQWKAAEEKPRTMAASGRSCSNDSPHPQRDLWAIRPRLAYLMYLARNHKRKQENQQ
jgi:hypothetical protein